METSVPQKRERIPGWVKKVVPVLVSVGILYYYFHDQDWNQIIDACLRVDPMLIFLAIVVPQVYTWIMGTLVTERYFKWFYKPISFMGYLWVHGATYILMFVNTAFGGGGLLLYLQRKSKISWTKLLGMVVLRTLIVLGAMSFVMVPITLAMHYYGLNEKIKVNMYIWWGVLIFGVAWFTESWIFFHHRRFNGFTMLVFRDINSEFMTVGRLAKRKHWLLTFAMVIPGFILHLLGYYFLNPAFNVNVPFLEFMVAAPAALLIAGLPIAVAGFGTTTVAWMTFFGDYGSREDIAALTLFIPFARAATKGVIGIISLKPALKEISTITNQIDPESG